jgi:hypothetical protein
MQSIPKWGVSNYFFWEEIGVPLRNVEEKCSPDTYENGRNDQVHPIFSSLTQLDSKLKPSFPRRVSLLPFSPRRLGGTVTPSHHNPEPRDGDFIKEAWKVTILKRYVQFTSCDAYGFAD